MEMLLQMFQQIASNPDRFLNAIGGTVLRALGDWPLLARLAELLMATAPLIGFFAGCFAITTWLERKGLARIQNRIGPNRVGPFGLLQPAADGIKMLMKEDITPEVADKGLHLAAPVLMVIPAFLSVLILPFSTNVVPVLLDNAVLYFFAVGAFSTLAVFLAGWSSRNKYSLLGGMRAIAQMVSYEMPLVLAAVTPVMMAGSLSTPQIVESQQIVAWVQDESILKQAFGMVLGWNVFTPWGFAGFLIFFICSLAELNRSPFDLPEADSEIIAGHLTEYSGFKYALFFMGEYVSAFAISGMAVTLFLGGWCGPNIRPWWSNDPDAWMIPGVFWFVLKMFALMMIMIWVRGTMPRLRVDQLMGFAWKFLLPMSLVNIFVAGMFYYLPWQLGWITGIVVLYMSYQILVKLFYNNQFQPRVYRYAS